MSAATPTAKGAKLPRKGRQAAAHQRINQSSGHVEFFTPLNIVGAAREAMDGIDLDPASSAEANRRVEAARFFSRAEDGLAQEWSGRVWLNHPFGRVENTRWPAKLAREFRAGRVTAACCLTFACTSEEWFQPLAALPQCYLTPRTNFILPNGTVFRGVPKGSVVTYFGPEPHRFAVAFRKLGVVKAPYIFP